jgi:hypothetical protein
MSMYLVMRSVLGRPDAFHDLVHHHAHESESFVEHMVWCTARERLLYLTQCCIGAVNQVRHQGEMGWCVLDMNVIVCQESRGVR